MSTVVHLPNGSKVSVPTDDPTKAAQAAQAYWDQLGATGHNEARAGPALPKAPPRRRTALQTAGDFLGDTIDNLIPNFGDEISAIPDAAKAAVTGKPIGEAWNRGRQDFREHQAQYDQEHPYLAWGSTLAGTGASLALPAGELAQGAGWGAKLLHGAAVGAAYGGIAGAGEGDTLEDRAGNALSGALIGGATGAAASPVVAGVKQAARAITDTVPGAGALGRTFLNVPRSVMRRPLRTRQMAEEERANRLIHRRMSEGNIATGFGQSGPAATPQAIEAEVRRRQSLGVPAIAGDVSESMRGLTSWASRGMGPGQTMVRRALDARKATEATRVRGHITGTLGDAVDPYAQMEAHSRRARAEAAPMYREAYSQPVAVTPEMQEVMETPAFRQALPQAFTNVQNAKRNPLEMGFRIAPDGSVVAGPTLTTEAYDHVIRQMRDNGRTAAEVNQLTGQVRNNTNSVHINARAGDLHDQLAAQNGAYRDVTSMYADEMGTRDALEAGTKFLNQTGSEVRAVGEALPVNARPSWAIGARSALADRASQWGSDHQTGSTAAHVRRALGDDAKQQAVEHLLGPDADLQRLRSALEAEHQGNLTWAEVQGNSKTAARQQTDADLDDELVQLRPSSWSLRGLAGAGLKAVAARTDTEARRAVKAHVAQVVTEPDPDRLAGIMRGIQEQAAREETASAIRHRTAILGAKIYGANVKAPDAGHYGSEGDWYETPDGFLSSPDGTMQFKFGDD